MTTRPAHPRRDERGEGVISAAIAVLVMAFLGAAMWLAFNTIFANTAKNACEQARRIGETGSALFFLDRHLGKEAEERGEASR